MAQINKVDTDGSTTLLSMGEFGYDNYPAGGDEGRVYIGTGTEDIPLARQDELGLGTAADTTYDNTDSDLVAANVKTALDELDTDIDNIETGTTDIAYDNTDSGLTATTIKTAIDEAATTGGGGTPTYAEIFTATGGETAVTIPNSKAYVVANGELIVSIEGTIQILGIDYTETSTTSVTFVQALVADEHVIFQKV